MLKVCYLENNVTSPIRYVCKKKKKKRNLNLIIYEEKNQVSQIEGYFEKQMTWNFKNIAMLSKK